ncbi:MAG: hypothetical protein FGF50_11190 [Candidatus Brockarchaeota archaeon]|nr:hypothetical protein [Candidatus Brockarchaeota archaeon]
MKNVVFGMAGGYELEDVEGIGPATAKKLMEAGYATVEPLAVWGEFSQLPLSVKRDDLMRKTGLSEEGVAP